MFFESISLGQYIFFASCLVGIGLFGILTTVDNIISYIISLELIFLAINIIFVAIGRFHGNVNGQALVIFILSITAAEIATIIGITIMHYKNHGTISIESTANLNEITN